MGEVVVFRPRRQEHPPPLATPMPPPGPPSWAERHLEAFFDLDRWPVSQKGNRYLRIDGYCVTMFPRPGGWAWCIASSADHKPLWSDGTFGSEREARADAWEALKDMVLAEHREPA